MNIFKKLFGGPRNETSEKEVDKALADEIEKFTFILVFSHAMVKALKQKPNLETASVMLAMNENKKGDLVERPQGLMLSRACADRLSHYVAWATSDGEIIITGKFPGSSSRLKPETQQFLKQKLPSATRLGKIDILTFAVALCKVFGKDAGSLLVKEEERLVAVY